MEFARYNVNHHHQHQHHHHHQRQHHHHHHHHHHHYTGLPVIFCLPLKTISAERSSKTWKNKVAKKLLIARQLFEYNQEAINTLASKLTS